ncbi:MAG: hypothetical protein J1F35_08260 [Erysipelotrichales bacterium]|nr:hypothetical protein [Erysipelotrichales bacterium]
MASRTKIRNFLNKKWSEISNNRYKDQDWSGFRSAIDWLSNHLKEEFLEDKLSLYYYCKDGGYRQTSDGLTKWKEYIIEVLDSHAKILIKGYINCCACGSLEDPFSTYDLVFVNWLDDEK